MAFQYMDKVVVTHSATKYDGREGDIVELLPRQTYRVRLFSRKRTIRPRPLGPPLAITDPAEEVVFQRKNLKSRDDE